MLLDAQAPPRGKPLEDRVGLLPKVWNLEDVGEDVIAVVPHQRIGVEEDRRHAGDEHHVEAELIEDTLMGVPPEIRGDRGDDHLHVHPRRPDRRPLPLVGQHPAVGDVAVEAGGHDEQHHAHLVTLATVVLARQAVAKLVEDLGDPQRRGQVEPVARREELVKLRELRPEDVEVDEHEQQGAGHEHQGRDDRRRGEQPAEPGIEPLEQPVWVDAAKPHRHDVGKPGRPLPPDPLPPPLEELRPLPRPVADHEARTVQRGDKPRQFVDRDPPRRKPALKLLLERFEARLAVEHLEQCVFLRPEPEVVQRDRIFDDPPGLALVDLPVHDEVAPATQRNAAGGARTKGVGGGHGRLLCRSGIRVDHHGGGLAGTQQPLLRSR